MGGPVDVSVVLPAYNEAESLESTVTQTIATLDGFLPAGSYEVIIAEDGCTDETPAIAESLADKYQSVRHIHFAERQGRGRALRHAIEAANGSTVAYFDTDLSTDLKHLEELIDAIRTGTADIATGSRLIPNHESQRAFKRSILSRGYNWLVRQLLRSDLYDHQCGFKAFDKQVILELLRDVKDNHWFWDTEILVRAQRDGYIIKEFPVDWSPDHDTSVDFIRDIIGMGSQLIRTWWELSIQPRVTPRRSIAGGLLLVLVAIGLMTVYLDPQAVLNELRAADPLYVALAGLVYVASWPIRGLRYRDILEELDYPSGLWFLVAAVFTSQTGNLVFPARAGDAIRAYIVKTKRGVPYPVGFASLGAERVYDLLALTGLAGVVLLSIIGLTGGSLALPGTTEVGSIADSGRVAVIVAAGVGIAAIGITALIVISANTNSAMLQTAIHWFSTDSYAGVLIEKISEFVNSIQLVTATPEVFVRIGVLSVVIWIIDILTAFLVLQAFATGLPTGTILVVCFFAVSVGNLAKVLPLSPGGIGLYEGAFTLLVIALTPLTVPVALGAAILDHGVKNATTIIGGACSMVILNVSLQSAIKEGKDQHAQDTGTEETPTSR